MDVVYERKMTKNSNPQFYTKNNNNNNKGLDPTVLYWKTNSYEFYIHKLIYIYLVPIKINF